MTSIDEVDVEFASLIKKVVTREIPAAIAGDRVFRTNGAAPKSNEFELLNEVAFHVNRNDPCVCGSSKKFKKCCGKDV